MGLDIQCWSRKKNEKRKKKGGRLGKGEDKRLRREGVMEGKGGEGNRKREGLRNPNRRRRKELRADNIFRSLLWNFLPRLAHFWDRQPEWIFFQMG